MQEPLSKVRLGKSGDPKLTCLVITTPETTWKPCNLTQKTRTANGMMLLSLRWNLWLNTKYSKSGIKLSLINIRKSKTLLKVIKGSKFDGRHKARLVADGHLTPEPIENIYSGVVSLRNLRLVIFLGKLNNLELWGADIGNAYLEAFTDEKLYIVAGPEFQELEGYILIFLKALYGLKSSGKRWAEVIHGILRDMKFLPSKADPCIWLRKAPNLRCYEYIAVYVDDLCIAAESPSAIIQIFKSKYHFKVKGDGKLTYHLGADYFEDPDGTFVSQPKKYIDKLADTYKRLFNEDPPKGYKTPLDKNDHPELDTSEILEGDMAAKISDNGGPTSMVGYFGEI